MTISRTRSGVELTSRYSMMHFFLHTTSRISDSELEITRPRLLLGSVPIGSTTSVYPLSRIRFVGEPQRSVSLDGWGLWLACMACMFAVPSLPAMLIAGPIALATIVASFFTAGTRLWTTSGIVPLSVWSPGRSELVRFCDHVEQYLAAEWQRARVEGTLSL